MASIGPGDAVVRADEPTIGPHWQVFREPEVVFVATTSGEVASVIEAACARAESGRTVVGFLAYEAATALDAALVTKIPGSGPLAWFASYSSAPEIVRDLLPPAIEPRVELEDPDWDLDAYTQRFEVVREGLASGDNYQTNLTFAQRFRLTGSVAALFASRCGVDPPPYATFIDGGTWQVACFSPELLFERDGSSVVMRPMKGTAPIPEDPAQRVAASDALRHDPKTIAENIMIVDMVRNDLGAVCEVGSIQTPKLLEVESHRGLYQVTSTVTGRCAQPTPAILRVVFPAASVTGAPKAETMKKIAALESEPRGIYCGAIGIMKPGSQRFAVGIRTAWIQGERGVFGVGSGVVWDSSAEAEYAECLLKRDRLLVPGKPFEWIEAIAAHRLRDSAHVAKHLDRLERSARATGLPLPRAEIEAAIRGAAERAIPADLPPHKLRIVVSADGSIAVELTPSRLPNRPLRVALAKVPVSSLDPTLRYKTSSRAVLDSIRQAFPDHDEVLCFNREGQLTEFTYGNVAVKLDGAWYTPPPEVGCLDGIEVQERLEAGHVYTKILTFEDLRRAERLAFLNSVVGWLPVVSLDSGTETHTWTAEDSSPLNRQSC